MKSITKNNKAYFEYNILEKHIAGIILEGSEVKSIRASR
jgi:tmRNA-binding protein